MTAPLPPYTPETLAIRWGCTAQHIRNMLRRANPHAGNI